MKVYLTPLAALGVLALASCSSTGTGTDPAQIVYALDASYIVAANAEAVYTRSAIATPSVVAQMQAYDMKAYQALTIITPIAQSSGTVDSALLATAQAAVTAFSSYVTQNKGAAS